MSEVNVNIRGQDQGLGSSLDNLRQKARDLGKDMSDLNRLSDLTPTQQKLTIDNAGQDTLRAQQEKIRSEYADLRRSNLGEFRDTEEKFKSGEISSGEFNRYKSEFKYNQDDLSSQEKNELLEVEKEMSSYLREIHKELVNERKIEREKKQRDSEEFRGSGGLQGQLLEENRKLKKQQFLSEDQDEIASLQKTIDENNSKISSLKRPDGGGGGGDGGANQGLMTIGAAGRGDLMGTIGGGIRGAGQMGGFAKGAGIAAIIAYILKEAVGFGEGVQESVAPIAAMRGGQGTGADFNSYLRGRVQGGQYDFGGLGLKNEEVAEAMRSKAVSSGRSDNDLLRRTYEDESFKKAFGADAGIFSEFERFESAQKESVEVALDMLNVLSSIENSSLKENDLTTLGEKLQAQQTIMSFQRSKKDEVDSDKALRVLAAFESIGLSGKGERASGFLNQTLQGLGEGGGDNLQMLKIEAARRSNPELSNDPAALRRLVKFSADDPEYMNEFFKMAGQMTGGDDMAMDDLIYSFFNPESEADMDMYKKAMKSGDFSSILGGGKLDKMKTRKSSLDKETMISDAESGVGNIQEITKDFSNLTQRVLSFLLGASEGDRPFHVNVVKDSSGRSGSNNQSNQVTNKIKGGE